MAMVLMLRFSRAKLKLRSLFIPPSGGGDESFQDMLILMNRGYIEMNQESDQADEGAEAG